MLVSTCCGSGQKNCALQPELLQLMFCRTKFVMYRNEVDYIYLKKVFVNS